MNDQTDGGAGAGPQGGPSASGAQAAGDALDERLGGQSDAPDAQDADGDGQPAVPITLVAQDRVGSALADLPPDHAAWARTNRFAGRLGQSLLLPGPGGAVARVLIGWGDAEARRRERYGLAGFAAGAPAGTYRLETPLEPQEAELAALGWLLARYRFDRYKSAGSEVEAHLLAPDGVDARRLGLIAEGVFITRDLINTPANDMGPAALEAAARRLATRHGARIDVTAGDALIQANLPLIHAVGRAAAAGAAPRLIDLSWGAEDAPRVTLVGKGVCFDTGGLNLKPGASMGLMKKDMGGAATVLGLAHMIMATGLGVRLRVLIPAVENSVSGTSFRPGDILRSRKGLTVEVNNTDAEGRLVLADALALACEEKPALILDMATLTGAARVALGPEVPPFFTDDEELAQALTQTAAETRDPLWRLPLWPGYERDIEPKIADLDNAPGGGMAGAITAALFLRRFVEQTAWVHLDLYGWTPADRPGRPRGGEAQGARACLALVERRFGGTA